MILSNNTSDNAGATIYAYYNDFEGLYEALHDIACKGEKYYIQYKRVG